MTSCYAVHTFRDFVVIQVKELSFRYEQLFKDFILRLGGEKTVREKNYFIDENKVSLCPSREKLVYCILNLQLTMDNWTYLKESCVAA